MPSQSSICRECGSSFSISLEAMAFFEEKGFSVPKICSHCRTIKKITRRTTTEVSCAECGDKTTVPFIPKEGGRPIYCGDCYVKSNSLSSDNPTIYDAKPDIKKISSIIIEINDDIKRYFAKHPEKLYDLSPRKFEELIADIISDFGFDVELTPPTHDGGKDILAYMHTPLCSFLTLVECKRWKRTKHVGIEVVQRLAGVQHLEKANKSMIVTTSFFSKPAIEECKRQEILMSLCDYNTLKEWLLRYY